MGALPSTQRSTGSGSVLKVVETVLMHCVLASSVLSRKTDLSCAVGATKMNVYLACGKWGGAEYYVGIVRTGSAFCLADKSFFFQ